MNGTIFLASVLLAAGTVEPLALPGAEGSIGFDDLRYSPELHKVLAPGGRSGRLYLVDPDGMASLHEFFAELWPAGLARLKRAVESDR